jgi:hypothetical protein
MVVVGIFIAILSIYVLPNVIFLAIWCILWLIGIFFGILYREKSGNLGSVLALIT